MPSAFSCIFQRRAPEYVRKHAYHQGQSYPREITLVFDNFHHLAERNALKHHPAQPHGNHQRDHILHDVSKNGFLLCSFLLHARQRFMSIMNGNAIIEVTIVTISHHSVASDALFAPS